MEMSGHEIEKMEKEGHEETLFVVFLNKSSDLGSIILTDFPVLFLNFFLIIPTPFWRQPLSPGA